MVGEHQIVSQDCDREATLHRNQYIIFCKESVDDAKGQRAISPTKEVHRPTKAQQAGRGAPDLCTIKVNNVALLEKLSF